MRELLRSRQIGGSDTAFMQVPLETPIIPDKGFGPLLVDGKIVRKNYIEEAMEVIAAQGEVPEGEVPENAIQLLMQEAQHHGYGEILTPENTPAPLIEVFPGSIKNELKRGGSVMIDYIGNVAIGKTVVLLAPIVKS